MKKTFALFLSLMLIASHAYCSDEIPLFDRTGSAQAYIAVDDEMTIYLWSGKPVAYLERTTSEQGFDVWGFNGKHLGWFSRGVLVDEKGAASCAAKERMSSTQYEPYKGYRQYKPYKRYKEYAPSRPFETNSFGATPCSLLLAGGA